MCSCNRCFIWHSKLSWMRPVEPPIRRARLWKNIYLKSPVTSSLEPTIPSQVPRVTAGRYIPCFMNEYFIRNAQPDPHRDHIFIWRTSHQGSGPATNQQVGHHWMDAVVPSDRTQQINYIHIHVLSKENDVPIQADSSGTNLKCFEKKLQVFGIHISMKL
jgi:hypothetical protein